MLWRKGKAQLSEWYEIESSVKKPLIDCGERGSKGILKYCLILCEKFSHDKNNAGYFERFFTGCLPRYRMAVAACIAIQKQVNRTVWCKPRTRGWWETVTNGLFGEEWWKENFRMTEDTFKMLCSYLHPYLVKKTARFRNPISVE